MTTWRDIYPTGRKHCSRCKRWRLCVDFQVRRWADEPACTVPRTLSSVCTVCETLRRRKQHGSKPRVWYPHGAPGTRQYIQHRREMNRASAKYRRQDPLYRELEREYHRIWRNAKVGALARQTQKSSSETKVPRKPFDDFVKDLGITPSALALSSGMDEGTFRSRTQYILLSTIDRALTAIGLPDQVVVLYPVV